MRTDRYELEKLLLELQRHCSNTLCRDCLISVGERHICGLRMMKPGDVLAGMVSSRQLGSLYMRVPDENAANELRALLKDHLAEPTENLRLNLRFVIGDEKRVFDVLRCEYGSEAYSAAVEHLGERNVFIAVGSPYYGKQGELEAIDEENEE